jgi:hypothetical protein
MMGYTHSKSKSCGRVSFSRCISLAGRGNIVREDITRFPLSLPYIQNCAITRSSSVSGHGR